MYKRDKNDLWVLGHKVPVFNALTTYTFELTHLDGRKVPFQTSGVLQPNAVMKVLGLGMPVKNSPGEFGDLYINFKVVLPETPLTAEKITQLSAILPPAPAITLEEGATPNQLEKVDHPDEDEMDDEEDDYHDHGHGHGHHGHGHGHDDDEGSHEQDEAGEEEEDEEEGGHGQQAGCAPQ